MKLVINIDEEDREKIKNAHKGFFLDLYKVMATAIRDGRIIPKGHWIQTDNYFSWRLNYVECSCCHNYSLEEGDYCPNCGARMEVVEK